jgi:hypothetical protein
MDVSEMNDTFVPALVPNSTVESDVNPVPVIVTVVPPAVGPAVGLIALTAGANAGAGEAKMTAPLLSDPLAKQVEGDGQVTERRAVLAGND